MQDDLTTQFLEVCHCPSFLPLQRKWPFSPIYDLRFFCFNWYSDHIHLPTVFLTVHGFGLCMSLNNASRLWRPPSVSPCPSLGPFIQVSTFTLRIPLLAIPCSQALDHASWPFWSADLISNYSLNMDGTMQASQKVLAVIPRKSPYTAKTGTPWATLCMDSAVKSWLSWN